jgi:iron-sulfur cluster repair protein YtfE (RIC family)
MNAIELLIDQHRMLEARLKAALEATQPRARAALIAQLGDHLAAHIASEEEVFYPAVKALRTADILLESLEEHLSLKRLVADLLELPPAAPSFMAKLKALREQTEQHHREEEEHLFPSVRKAWDPQQLDVLGRQMVRLQQDLRNEGAPRELMAERTEEAARL